MGRKAMRVGGLRVIRLLSRRQHREGRSGFDHPGKDGHRVFPRGEPVNDGVGELFVVDPGERAFHLDVDPLPVLVRHFGPKPVTEQGVRVFPHGPTSDATIPSGRLIDTFHGPTVGLGFQGFAVCLPGFLAPLPVFRVVLEPMVMRFGRDSDGSCRLDSSTTTGELSQELFLILGRSVLLGFARSHIFFAVQIGSNPC